MSRSARLSRRTMLSGLAGVAGATILSACGGGSNATDTPKAAAGATSPTGANPFGSPIAATPTRAAAATTAAGGTTTTGAGATTAPAITAAGSKLTYWGSIVLSDDAQNVFVNAAQDWGKQNKINVEVVMINVNDLNTKYAAALESGTLPDAMDIGLDLLQIQSTKGKFAPLDDLYDKIGKTHGGWLKSLSDAVDPKILGGARTGIPYGNSGNLLFMRKDVLAKAGFTPPPKTWQEISDWSAKVTASPLYGMGFALSNVGDGNLQVQVIQSWGGRVADDTGKKCTIKSPETKTYLEWVSDAFKRGLFPPGVTTWDGSGDNNAYQAGQLVFIANTGSVYNWMKANDKDLLNSTIYSAMPSGPKTRVSTTGPWLRAIPAGGKNIEAAKALVEALMNKDMLAKYYPNAIWGPVLQEHLALDAFKDPVHAGLADLSVNGTAPAYPDVNNGAFAEFNNNFIVPKMIQRVVIDKLDIDKAMDEAQKAGDAIYAKSV